MTGFVLISDHNMSIVSQFIKTVELFDYGHVPSYLTYYSLDFNFIGEIFIDYYTGVFDIPFTCNFNAPI